MAVKKKLLITKIQTPPLKVTYLYHLYQPNLNIVMLKQINLYTLLSLLYCERWEMILWMENRTMKIQNRKVSEDWFISSRAKREFHRWIIDRVLLSLNLTSLNQKIRTSSNVFLFLIITNYNLEKTISLKSILETKIWISLSYSEEVHDNVSVNT